jgi:uncharacterized membrane protein
VDLYDWLLFLHVLSAFAIVASVVVFAVLVATSGATPSALRLTALGRRLWDVGGAGTLVFGVWLALHVQGYSLSDGWIIAALVLWVIAAVAGVRLGTSFQQAGGTDRAAAASGQTLLLWTAMTLAVAALLADMIFKPGA